MSNNVNNVTAEFTPPVVSRQEPVLPRQDEDYCIQLTRRDVGIAFVISIIGLAIAYQYFCEAPMAALNTKLKNTGKEIQAAHESEKMFMLDYNCSSQCDNL